MTADIGSLLQGMLQLHSHKPPILHRDLKSPNLLVDKHWRVKIADFNLSRVMEAQAVVSSISANNPRLPCPCLKSLKASTSGRHCTSQNS